MKKKFIKIAVAAVVVAAAGYGVYLNQSKANAMSDLELANLEALAGDETVGTIDCCNDKEDCPGDFCGVFDHVSGNSYKVYYKTK